MAKEKVSYLENEIGASITKSDGRYTYIFQKALLQMKDELELQVIKGKDAVLNKEIEVKEDEVLISFSPPSDFAPFSAIHNKTDYSKWVLSYQLIRMVSGHRLGRLIPVVCPENLMFDSGYTPYLLHYGVKESLPPYGRNEEHLLETVKATICAIVDKSHSFEEYLKYHSTLKLSKEAQSIMKAESLASLEETVRKQIKNLDALEKTYVRIPDKRWKLQRYLLLAFILLFIPAFAYAIYSLVFLNPKQDAYIESQRSFLEKNYSEVVTLLESYDADEMPYVIKYQLSHSYVMNESLQEDQREAVLKSITLQTDEQLLLYWIYLGRGNNEEALEIARVLEDRDLIMMALFKYQDELKADEDMKSEDRKEKLDEIERELEDFKDEIEQEKKEAEEAAESETETPAGGEPAAGSQASQPAAGQQPASGTAPAAGQTPNSSAPQTEGTEQGTVPAN